MTDTTSPDSGTVEATPMSFDAGVSAIENLLSDDPETDLVDAGEANASVSEPSDEDEPELVLDDEDADGAAEEQTEAPSELSDDVVITLKDGEKISLGDLKRNNLFQRDYTRKTEELKQQREQLQQEFQKQVSEAETEIRQRRDFILDNWQRFIPQEPDQAMLDDKSDKFDPIGYMQARTQYDDAINRLNAMHNERETERTTLSKQEEEAAKEFAQAEWGKFLERVPRLKTEEKLRAFRDDVKQIGLGHYGLKPEELTAVTDHRFQLIIHDAIAYQKLVQKSQAAKQEIAAKPKIRTQQRMSPQTVQSRDRHGRFEALRNSGSIDAAAKSIMDLID